MIKARLSEIIDKAADVIVQKRGREDIKMPLYAVDVPPGNVKADFATNIALMLSAKLGESSMVIAGELVTELVKAEELFEAVKFVKPGFINFYMNRKVFYEEIKKINKSGENYGSGDFGRNKKIMIEFVSANPTGPLHVGHGRGAAIGDSMANIMKTLGYDVVKEYYVNDVGNQIDMLTDSLAARRRETAIPEGGYEGEYIKIASGEMAGELDDYLQKPTPENKEKVRRSGVELMLRDIKKDLEDFGLKFDSWFFESTLYRKAENEKNEIEQALEKLKRNNYIFEQDGAIWFRSTSFGDDKDRVVIKNDMSKTYLASDIAYHYDKFKRGFDTVINIWGADHHGYIDRVKGSVTAMGYDSVRLKILLYQLVNLTREGKPVVMSKRKADYVTLRQVIDEVGSDACRFFFLMRNANTPLDFDLELAKKQSQDNPVYYVQYGHARICSIFKEAEKAGIKLKAESESNLELLNEQEELELMKRLGNYSGLLLKCCITVEPHHLTSYLQDLVGVFHSYYAKHRIIGDNEELTAARLQLLKALAIVIKNGLKILGVTAPERM